MGFSNSTSRSRLLTDHKRLPSRTALLRLFSTHLKSSDSFSINVCAMSTTVSARDASSSSLVTALAGVVGVSRSEAENASSSTSSRCRFAVLGFPLIRHRTQPLTREHQCVRNSCWLLFTVYRGVCSFRCMHCQRQSGVPLDFRCRQKIFTSGQADEGHEDYRTSLSENDREKRSSPSIVLKAAFQSFSGFVYTQPAEIMSGNCG